MPPALALTERAIITCTSENNPALLVFAVTRSTPSSVLLPLSSASKVLGTPSPSGSAPGGSPAAVPAAEARDLALALTGIRTKPRFPAPSGAPDLVVRIAPLEETAF